MPLADRQAFAGYTIARVIGAGAMGAQAGGLDLQVMRRMNALIESMSEPASEPIESVAAAVRCRCLSNAMIPAASSGSTGISQR